MTKKFKKVFAAALLAVAVVFALRAAIPNEGDSIVLNVTEQAKLWDFSGSYSESIEVNGVIVDLEFELLHDADGNISGTGTARVEGFDEGSGEEMSMESEFNVSGKVRTAGLLTRLEIKLESELSDVPAQLATKLAIIAELDGDGEVTSTISGNLSVVGDQPKQLDIPANTELVIMLPDDMDGSWEIKVDNITGEGHEFSGNGYVILSNGRELELAAKLTHKQSFDTNGPNDTITFNFTYPNTDLPPMSNSIPLTVVAIVRSFGPSDGGGNPPDGGGNPPDGGGYNDDMVEVKSFKGNLLGQTFSSVSDEPTVPPVITRQPLAQSAAVGDSVMFSVGATGGGLEYQWKKNATFIDGETNDTLTLSDISSEDAGGYTVTVKNSKGAVTSKPAMLTVLAPPEITTQPIEQTVVEGDKVTLIVAATGTGPLKFQWKLNGSPISGATKANYVIAKALAGHAGDYSVEVSNNSAVIVTSDEVSLTVTIPKPVITKQPLGLTVAVGGTAKLSVTAKGSGLTYQWFKDEEVLSGETSATLTLLEVVMDSAGDYTVTVTNDGGEAESKVAIIKVITLPPKITTQPLTRSASAGNSVEFFVEATGGSLEYQWKKNGLAIEDETNETLTLSDISSADAGSYTVTVKNSGGTVTSKAAKLSICFAPTSLDGYSVTFKPTKRTGYLADEPKEPYYYSFSSDTASVDGWDYDYEYTRTSATAGTASYYDENLLVTFKITFKTATWGSYTAKGTDLDSGKTLATETGTFIVDE